MKTIGLLGGAGWASTIGYENFLVVGLLFVNILCLGSDNNEPWCCDPELCKIKFNEIVDYAHPNDELPEFGLIPIIVALREGWIDVLEKLITAGANVNPKLYRSSLLHCVGSNPKTVKMLLDAGADPHIENDNHWTPIWQFAYNRNHESIQVMLEAGVMPKPWYWNIRGVTQDTYDLFYCYQRAHGDFCKPATTLFEKVVWYAYLQYLQGNKDVLLPMLLASDGVSKVVNQKVVGYFKSEELEKRIIPALIDYRRNKEGDYSKKLGCVADLRK